MMNMMHLYLANGKGSELCFNIESTRSLQSGEFDKLRLLLADGFDDSSVTVDTTLEGKVVELGPRLNFETPWSTNMIAICQAVGLDMITRLEKSRRFIIADGASVEDFVAANHDRMTECVYPERLSTFTTDIKPQEVYSVPMIEKGPDALKEIPGISMDEWDRQFYYDYFVTKHGRNPTIVEIMDLNNANSEHSRHGYFKGKNVINGQEMSETLFQIVVSTWKANHENSIIAFSDNSSGIQGGIVRTIAPLKPGEPSKYGTSERNRHIIFTAETHNFPTGVAPFPGAETGSGGRIRDIQATGRGGLTGAGTAGYCVSNLFIPEYKLSWELELERPETLASGLQIVIEASNGASRYGNEYGEPLILGHTRSFDLRLDNGERWGFLKPIMFTGGIGQIDDCHIKKNEAKAGMLIVQIGGPAYRVGFGGGAASSLIQGDQEAKLDFNAVQRGNAEMEKKMFNVNRACIEMDFGNPIESIHDQGAGGPANVLKELVTGGQIDIRQIKVADPTMSVLEIWVAEYQERNGLLIKPDRIEEFKAICAREKVNCEVLGEVTDDGIFTVHDSDKGTTPVVVNLQELMGNMPQKIFTDESVERVLKPFQLPERRTFADALTKVLSLISVGSKRFLTNKADRCVTGLVAQQQCCGPLQLTVADVAVISQGYYPDCNGLYPGAATSIGEQPIKMLVNPAAGARMAVGEVLTNLVGAKITGLNDVKCSANWMWAPKLPGEGAAMYEAAVAMRDCMITLGIAIDGGKDSLSMATRVGSETVKSPRQLVISAYAAMPDITKVATADIKKPGESQLIYIDLANGQNRLGGSALAQVYGQIGDESPDMDDPEYLRCVFNCVQDLVDNGLVLACHDRSDGGLVVTLLEMAFAGNCGLDIRIHSHGENPINGLFSEELGIVVECHADDVQKVMNRLSFNDIYHEDIGETTADDGAIRIHYGNELVLETDMRYLRHQWEETSYQLEKLQANPECVIKESENNFDRTGPKYVLTFEPEKTAPTILQKDNKPKVAILREEGSNSDREMAAAFLSAGFEPWDVTMTDLLEGRISLDGFRGLAAVGGFSYADVPQSAKGWAATIKFNEKLQVKFDEFYHRPDTFSLGVCNGCQLFGLLGWVPWRGIDPKDQPRFVLNDSGRFESRWSTVKVLPSPAIMFNGMEGSVLGIHVAHGEGKSDFPNNEIWKTVRDEKLYPLAFTDDNGVPTSKYPFCPNGSRLGIAALTTRDGRHLAMMPHPERAFIKWEWHYMPEQMKKELEASPWLRMFQNAYNWCMK